MSNKPVDAGNGAADEFDPTDGWGEVPEADRPLWARYMLDYCPQFLGPTIMTLIARGVVFGGTKIPEDWKETAAELHNAGFTPLHYYLLASLLSDKRRREELDEATHGYLFKKWYGNYPDFPDFRLDAEAWKPWLERIDRAESPGRALDHMLHGPFLPPLGAVFFVNGPTQVASD